MWTPRLPLNDDEAAREILSQYRQRQLERGKSILAMEKVRDAYNGDTHVYLPELDKEEQSAVPNLIAQGIDQYSMRVASVRPDIWYPSFRPGFKGHDQAADNRRNANLGWWDMNKWDMQTRRRARHLSAYGSTCASLSPISLDPTDKRRIPHWRVRNPLTAFPSSMSEHLGVNPENCIFTDKRTLGWLQANYPGAAQRLYKGRQFNDTTEFKVLEYVDDREHVLVVVGQDPPGRRNYKDDPNVQGYSSCELLMRIVNKAEVCPVVFAGRITLDRIAGQFDQMIGMYMMQSKLMALSTIAIVDNVFNDQWAVGTPNAIAPPNIIVHADGKRGIIGEIQNAQLQTIHNPGPQDAMQMMDRLEANQRSNGGVPADWGAESASNIRTGRRGQDILGATVDGRIQEDQTILANSFEQENEIACRIMKSYYGDEPSMFFIPKSGKIEGPGDYVPNELFTMTYSKVEYAMAGTDAQGLTIMLAQKYGGGLMSQQTAMEADPMIKDARAEIEKIEIEKLRKSLMDSLDQQAAQGQIAPHEIAQIIEGRLKGEPIEAVVQQVQKDVQKQQAAQAQAQQEQAGSSEAQPGLDPTQPTSAPAPQGAQGPPDLVSLLASAHPATAGKAPMLTSNMPATGPATASMGSAVPVGA